VAIGLLVTSAEIALTSGTGYSMPAHLLLNLLWLLLYLRGDTLSWAGALLIGVLALGLHQPVPHALFVAPFLLRLLRDRRWGRAASAAAAYGVVGAVWIAWIRFVNPVYGDANAGVAAVFALPGLAAVALHAMNMSLLLTWHTPALGALVLAAIAHPRKLDPRMADLALGVLLTVGFYTFFPATQGHGWGYRYAYQILGSLALLGAAGLPTVASAVGSTRARRWLAASLCYSLLVQLPLRMRDAEAFVRPFARAVDFVRSRDAHVVLVNGDSLWYGRDLIRNDPFLEQPIVVRSGVFARGSTDAFERAFPGRVVEISDSTLLEMGMTPLRRR
jgi:hypothetical protein